MHRRDVNQYTKAQNTLEPLTVYEGHTSVVGVSKYCSLYSYSAEVVFKAVDWHPMEESTFASVGDDKMLLMCVFHSNVLCSGSY